MPKEINMPKAQFGDMMAAWSDETLQGMVCDLGDWLHQTPEGAAADTEWNGDIFDCYCNLLREQGQRRKDVEKKSDAKN